MTILQTRNGTGFFNSPDTGDFSFLEFDGDIISHSATRIVIAYSGASFVLTGTGFGDYDGTGWPTTGTITGLSASLNGAKVYTWSDFAPIDMELWRSLSEAHDGYGFRNLFYSGADTITGADQQDVLYGYSGDDLITGRAGDDLINGGAGRDVLKGGAGADTFEFSLAADSTAHVTDRISDLQEVDTINLSLIDANRVNGTSNDAFTIVGAFTGAAGQLTVTYDADHNRTVIAGDTDGDGKANLMIYAIGDHADFANFIL